VAQARKGEKRKEINRKHPEGDQQLERIDWGLWEPSQTYTHTQVSLGESGKSPAPYKRKYETHIHTHTHTHTHDGNPLKIFSLSLSFVKEFLSAGTGIGGI
jgi:hypothetical protein